MKTLILAAFLTIGTFAAIEKAEAFYGNAACTVSPMQAQCTVVNNYVRPISCMVHISGRTYYGPGFFENVPLVVYPGTYEYAYFNAYPGNPIVGAWANVDCIFL
jgi:hypothetical protein